MSLDRDTLFVAAALEKAFVSKREAAQALTEARAEKRSVGSVLEQKGLITDRARRSLEQVVEQKVLEQQATVHVEPGVLFPEGATLAARTPSPATPDRDTTAVGAASPSDDTVELPSAPGQLSGVLGDFEVLEKLGQGGMGEVYKARDTRLHRTVALKVLSSEFSEDREMAERFLREARSVAAINHPNVITVHGVGEHEGRSYMALEYVPGGDVQDLLDRSGSIDEVRALELVRDCARGLVAIEAAGLVHRDIKPANIFIAADGVAKLADLGLARSQVGDDRVTQTGAVVGTPAFMAPEQARGVPDLDVRTDIYALGACLFGCLTGQAPFEGSSHYVVVSNLLNEPTPDPLSLNPRLTHATAALIRKAMAKDRYERYASSQEFLEACEEALSLVKSGSDVAVAPAIESAAGPIPQRGGRLRDSDRQAASVETTVLGPDHEPVREVADVQEESSSGGQKSAWKTFARGAEGKPGKGWNPPASAGAVAEQEDHDADRRMRRMWMGLVAVVVLGLLGCCCLGPVGMMLSGDDPPASTK